MSIQEEGEGGKKREWREEVEKGVDHEKGLGREGYVGDQHCVVCVDNCTTCRTG